MSGLFFAPVKRWMDVSAAVVTLLLGFPVLATVGMVVRLSMGPPALFVQMRAGFRGKSFRLVKFRTMLDRFGPDGRPLPDGQRLTRVGAWLRSASLDELPTLWNVLRGDMSLVGPRPLLIEYLPLYSPEQARRHEVRPGITGWAQVNGRNGLTWEEKFILDVWYVDNRSLLLDLKILWMTARAVLLREGISAEGEATMPRFQGNPERMG